MQGKHNRRQAEIKIKLRRSRRPHGNAVNQEDVFSRDADAARVRRSKTIAPLLRRRSSRTRAGAGGIDDDIAIAQGSGRMRGILLPRLLSAAGKSGDSLIYRGE